MSPIRKPISSRTGKLQFIEQCNAIHHRKPTAKEAQLRGAANLTLAILTSLGVGFIAWQIAQGLGHVLMLHGVR